MRPALALRLHLVGDGHRRPEGPEDLAIRAREDIDPTPIIGELANLYGPLEYKHPTTSPLLIDVPLS